jgi:hypothetical protein
MARNRQVQSRTRSSGSPSSSAAKLAANRANAQASTGPRTPEGKAASSQNAVKHGLYSRRTMERLAGRENAAARVEYDAHLAGLQADWKPQGEREESLVDLMADQDWHLAELRREKDIYLDAQRAHYEFRPHEVNPLLLHEARLYSIEEVRLERSLNTLQRNLEHLHRWGPNKRVKPDAAAPETLPLAGSQARGDAAPTPPPPEAQPPVAPSPDAAEPMDAAPAPADAAPAYPTTVQVTPHGIVRTQIRDGITYTSVDPL